MWAGAAAINYRETADILAIVKPPDASQISSLYTRKTPYTDYV